MNRFTVAGACALFLVACSKTAESTTPPGTAPAAAAQTDSKAVLELGKDI
jgi:hypothetical protein